MLASDRTPSGATCKGVLQLEATFIDVKNMYLHRDSNPGLWNTVPCFSHQKKVASSWRTPLQVAPEGVLT